MRALTIFVFFVLSVGTTLAQAVCPTDILLGFARSAAACARAPVWAVCYGNGTVTAEPHVDRMVIWEKTGQFAPIADVRRVAVDSVTAWSVASWTMPGDLPMTRQRGMTALLYGTGSIQDRLPPLPTLRVQAQAALVIRRTPDIKGEIMVEYSVGREVIANGRTVDNGWLRVLVPDTAEVGWAASNLVKDEGFNTLAPVTIETPVEQPYQNITLVTLADNAPCAEAPASGLLLQSPDAKTRVTLTLNDQTIELAGTALMQSPDGAELFVAVLDGYALVDGTYVPAGAQVMGKDDAEPIPDTMIVLYSTTLPLAQLPTRFSPPNPFTADSLEAARVAFTAVPTPTPARPDPNGPDVCRYTLRRDTNLWAGPATFYEVVANREAGQRVSIPALAAVDAEGELWWQLSSSFWVEASAVNVTGLCQPIPVLEYINAPRYNTLVMETCETTNGPLREGQYVTITFRPPGWETRIEAANAASIDPGSLVINNRERLSVFASDIIHINETEWLREFYGYWEPSTEQARVVAHRLEYELICDLTVPAG